MLRYRRRNLLAGSNPRALLVAVLFLLFACLTATVNAETRSVEGLEFDSVVVWGSAQVEISQAEQNHLRLQGDAADIDRKPFFVQDGVLNLGRPRSGAHVQAVKFRLAVRDIKGLTLKGSGAVFVKPLAVQTMNIELGGSGDINLFAVSSETLNVGLAGSGDVRVAKATIGDGNFAVSGSGGIELGEFTARELAVSVNGSGQVEAKKQATSEQARVNVVGSGDVDIGSVRATEVDVNIMGSGDTTVWAVAQLNVSIMGSGDVSYHGDPQLATTVLGSGDVKRAR